MTLRDTFGYIPEWVANTFPKQGVDGARAKFLDELWEFLMVEEDGIDEAELPDVFITLLTYLDKLYTLERFEAMVAEKMALNMHGRKWDVNEDGTGQHRDE